MDEWATRTSGDAEVRSKECWQVKITVDARVIMPSLAAAEAAAVSITTAASTVPCRSDLCGDIGNDCCAPGAEARSCRSPGYEVVSGGTSSWAECLTGYG